MKKYLKFLAICVLFTPGLDEAEVRISRPKTKIRPNPLVRALETDINISKKQILLRLLLIGQITGESK